MTSSSLFAVTVVGEDRSGIVAAVSHVLYELGCNLEDVTSTILRGHFAMVLIVRSPTPLEADELAERLDYAGKAGDLVITARPVAETSREVAPPTHMVSVYGADRPGIVYYVARTLSEVGANITDLTSRVIGADDAPVYALMLEVTAQDGAGLEAALESIRSDLGVEVSLHGIDADVL